MSASPSPAKPHGARPSLDDRMVGHVEEIARRLVAAEKRAIRADEKTGSVEDRLTSIEARLARLEAAGSVVEAKNRARARRITAVEDCLGRLDDSGPFGAMARSRARTERGSSEGAR
jgi:hypothetical protein